jgi:tricorn protease
LDKSPYGRIAGADWSPDGRWVVYGLKDSRHTCAIKLCQVETGETHYVTPPRNLQDLNPTFDPGGRYLYFISYREFDPVYDSHYFDLNFPRGSRPYLVTLQQELSNPFIPRPPEVGPPPENGKKEEPGKETEGSSEKADEEKKEGEAVDAPAEKPQERPEEWTLKIDLEDIQNRVLAFPVPDGRYYQVEGIKGKVYFTSYPIEGSLHSTWHDSDNENKGTLEYYDLAERRKEFVVNGVGSFEFSRNRGFLIYRSGKHLRILKAGEKPDNSATGYNKKSGWINLDRVSLAISPPEEWQQMFREAWRLQRDHFWTEDMSRIDWQVVYKRYYKLIDRVSSRAEFSDLLWEMQGELGTSHAYELGGDYRTAPRYFQGELGADFLYDPETEGYRITHIVRGDPWQERFNSPLNDVGVNAKVGDVLLAIDGQRLSRILSPGELLVNRTNTEVQLTFISPNGAPAENSEEGKAEPWTALVKTLADDGPARYREWVERNRRQVHQETGERIGYVHIPDMAPFGYAEFHRYYLSESEREGLIIDVRFNGGGHVSQLLLEKLARRRLGYKKPRYGEAWPYPSHIVLGPLVAVTNEYASSDGDIFSHAFKLMRLGKLIGKRTWGGVIGIWPRYSLVDGTLTTQPEFSSWFEDVGWAVENYGAEPDIEVDIRPQDYATGKDPQLERAIKEILKALEESPPVQPDFGALPSRSLPKLPKVKKS